MKLFLRQGDLPSEVVACLHTTIEPRRAGQRLWAECFNAVRSLIFFSCGVSVLNTAFATAATIAAMEILKSASTTHSSNSFQIGLVLAYFCTSLLGQGAVLWNNRIRNRANQASHAFLVNLISRKLLKISSRVAARQSSGNLKVLITSDTYHVSEFLDNWIRNFIPAVIGLILILPTLYYFAGNAGLVGIAIMMAFLPISLGLNQITARFQSTGQGALDSLTALLGEWVKNVRLIRFLSWDKAFETEILKRLGLLMRSTVSLHLMACLTFGLSLSWWMVSIAGVFGIARYSGQKLDITGFFGSLWLISFLSSYFTHLPNTLRLFLLAQPSIRRISKLLLEEEQSELLRPNKENIEDIESNLEIKPVKVIFEKVCFSYGPDQAAIIQDLSLEIYLNRKLAMIGEIASGKTTFLKLLCGELPPTSGTIWIEFDGGFRSDLWTIGCYEKYRSHLAWVPQAPFVAADRISTNISLHETSAEVGLIESAYLAELEADLAAFPNGLQEEIGEGGINLSGGQKQRLNIARAYYSKRSFMVMDDALSAVDVHTEVALMQHLEDAARNFFLVTHRLAELVRVDEVLVMKGGKIVERGSPKVLASDLNSHFSQALNAYRSSVPETAPVPAASSSQALSSSSSPSEDVRAFQEVSNV